MRRFLGGVALGVLATLVGVGAIALRGGASARPEPSRTEAAVARRLRAWAMPSSARTLPNPTAPSEEVLAEGRAHFADHCASCHANDGSGRTELGRNLYPRAPDLRAAATQGLTDGELFWVIENGVRLTGMPAWVAAGKPEESWKLVYFIRHLPRLTDSERLEMERLNPRSPQEWRELEDEEEFLRGGEPPERRTGTSHH